ncbi:MAG TPA: ATP-binding protein [Gemmataceae bacterium]|nr:ATP-binding protein [Gemmataceae bacterium]
MPRAATLAALLGCASVALPTDLRPLTTVTDVCRTGPEDVGRPVRMRAVVTYCDPAGRCLFVQEADQGLFVLIPADNPVLAPGQRAEVRGTLIEPGVVDATEARVIGSGRPPEPVAVDADRFAARAEANRLVALRGVIRAAAVEGEHAVLHLVADRRRFRVFVRHLPAGRIDWSQYVDAEVNAVGVCGLVTKATTGREGGTKLLVHRLDDIVVTRPAPENPFALPVTVPASLPERAEHRVRISGQAIGPVADGVLTLQSAGDTFGVAAGPEVVARAGDRFDAVGFPTVRDGLRFLEDAVVRGYAPGRSRDGPAAAGLLPVVQGVRELRRMSADDVARGYPVRMQATVTFHEPTFDLMFVHDGNEGIFVYPPKGRDRVPAGTAVVLEGFSDPGEFAPSVRATTVTPVREGRLPDARRYSYDELLGGREDSQWVEVEAVVRGTGKGDDGEATLLLRFGPATVPALIAGTDPETLRPLFGATVRVRAACGSSFNDRRQWEGIYLYVPSADAIEVRRPAPVGLTDLPAQTIESLTHFDPDRGPGEPVKLSGHVIARRNNTVVLQDATGGVVIDLQPRQEGPVGARIEVQGYLVRRGGAWALEDGVTRPVTDLVEPPRVRDVTPGDIGVGGHASTLVRVEGVLVDQFPAGEGDQVFLLRSVGPDAGGHLFFPAVLPRTQFTPDLAELRPGTRVRVVGACSVPAERLMISSFRLILRDAADVEVVTRPPWWTAERAMTVAGAVALMGILTMAWVITLRRRVGRQTDQIRRRLEREAHLEAQYRDLFESASDAVFSLDAGGSVTAMNVAGRTLTGLRVGDSFLAAVVPSSAEDSRELVGGLAPVTKEVGLNGPTGVVLLEVSARPLVLSGSSTGVQAIARDLTQRRRLEGELRQAQKMEAIGRLAGGIAHDFNNLLTVINGNAEVLRDRLSGDDGSLGDEILRAGERAAALTRQLLAFSRKGVVTPKVLCPNDTIEAVQRMLARLVGERVEVRTDLDELAGHVKIDPGQLEQALLNLAVNARDAMPNGGTLTLRTRGLGDRVRIEVADTGVGMNAATRARIFEPFFTTKPVGEGTGLGLATVKSIVEQAGGTIAVHSEPGRGATFAIELPACRETAGLSSPVLSPPPPAANREVILLVEDEPAVQLLERRVLEMGRYEVLVASSGEEALTVLDRHGGPIDLLVTDVVMPGMTGRELATAINRRRPGLKTLFLSGYTPDEVLRQGVRAEEAHFLQKPFTPSSLLSKVREILSAADDGGSLFLSRYDAPTKVEV